MIVIAAKGTEYSDRLVKSIKKYTPDEKYVVCESDNYCIGSYLKGIGGDNEFMFMHDSMEVKDSEWLNRFRQVGTDIVCHSVFPLQYDNNHQELFSSFLPKGKLGVFGPIFYTKKETINRIIPFMKDHLPSNAIEMRAWERILGNIAEHLNLSIGSVYGMFNYDDVLNDRLDGLRKEFKLRD